MSKLNYGLFLITGFLPCMMAVISMIEINALEIKLTDMTSKYNSLTQIGLKLDQQIEPEQAKLHIDVLRMKNQMETYNVLIDHQQHRLARISKVRDIIKKTISMHNTNDDNHIELSREDIYKMASAIVDYSDLYDIPTNLMLGLLRQESAFDPNAVSSTGAFGLAQILPSTGKHISKHLNVKTYDLSDIQDNIHFGAYYISKMLDRYKDNPKLALQSYLAGEANVDKFIRGEIKEVPYDAENYSKSVMHYAEKYAELGIH